jgi:4-oxalocrotonate tautomerase family enzyme
MPFIRVDVAGSVSSVVRHRLLTETAALFAEITESPLDRVRSQVHELPGDSFAVGGVSIADSGEQAPFVSVDLLQGRPIEQHTAIIERMSALVAEIMNVPIERTRLRINEVAPHDWGIGGVPASELRRREIEGRAAPSAMNDRRGSH